MNEERLQTDILIIGGGAAGLNAAITARQAGLDVIVMDKAVIERSGHFAGGIDHFADNWFHAECRVFDNLMEG